MVRLIYNVLWPVGLLLFLPGFLPGPLHINLIGAIAGPVQEILVRLVLPAGFR